MFINKKSFSPIINKKSRILILGSVPGIKSLELKQYYGHPQNRFWKLLGMLCNYNDLYLLEYKKRIEILLNNGFALWDVIACCEGKGSSDSDIINEVPNNIPDLLCKYKNVKKICFNGNKAFSEFGKHFSFILSNYNYAKLPSTSPANAKFSLNDLYCIWAEATDKY